MSKIQLMCQNFSGTYARLNAEREQDITFFQFLWAVLSVGMQDYRSLMALGPRVWQYRISLGLAANSFLSWRADLTRTDDHDSLDGSEKSALSYWYGMAFAKLTAHALLQVPWLAHVDPILAAGGIRLSNPQCNQRPDLVGQDTSGNWHVIEAKGRSASVEKELYGKSKQQAQSVAAVDGQPPDTASACITSTSEQPILVELSDPPSSNEGAKWEFTDDFHNLYYAGIISFLQDSNADIQIVEGDREVRMAPVSAGPLHPGVSVGLLEPIFDAPLDAERVIEKLDPISDVDRGFVGPDGVVVLTDRAEWPEQ